MPVVLISSLPICLNLRRFFFHLGGPGLLLMGLLDNSFIPTPAAQDLATALLAASDPEWWLYYAVMSSAGAMLGGFLIFRLGRKGGEAALEGHISRRKVEIVTRRFREWGWGAVFFPAIFPPPFPAVPFFFAAGALKYPVRKYLALLGAGRCLRYLVVAYLASAFGGRIFRFLRDSEDLLLITLIAIVAAALIVTLWHLRKKRVEGSHQQS